MIRLTREQIKNLRERTYRRGHADGRKEVMALYTKLIENHNQVIKLLTDLITSNEVPVSKLGQFDDMVPHQGEDFSVRFVNSKT